MRKKKRPKRPRAKPRARARRRAAPAIRYIGRGQPSKYRDEFITVARVMCENGATEPDVARALGVDRVTLWRWKAEHPDFCNAVKTAKAIADDRVEAALYERATGYSIETTKLFHEGGKVIAVEQLEHYPPDPTSMIFWLKNRRPLDWRDRREIAHENLGGKRERELTDEELDRELEAIEARRQELLALPAIPGELVKK